MRRGFILLTFSTILILFFHEKLSAQLGAYDLPASAISSFEKEFNNTEKNNVSSWVQSHQGNTIGTDWRPTQKYYAVYKVYILELWFGCNSLTELNQVYDRLVKVKTNIRIAESLRKDIEIYRIPKSAISIDAPPLTGGGNVNVPFDPYVQIEESEEPEDSSTKDEKDTFAEGEEESLREVASSFEKINFDREEQQLLNNLRREFSNRGVIKFDGNKVNYEASKLGKKDGKENAKGGNGKKGWFPVSIPVSRWFATVLEILSDVFLPGELKQLVQKALTLAYMVAPELIDNIASNLAKLQKALTPGGLDNVLNRISKVAEVVYNIYNDLREVHRLFNNGNFQKVLKNTSLTEAANKVNRHAQKYGLDLKSKLPNKIKEYFHYGDCVNLTGIHDQTLDCFKGKVIDDFSNAAIKTVPGMDNVGITPTDVSDLINGNKSLEQLGKEKSKTILCHSIPASKYNNACQKFLDGNPLDAAIEIGYEEFRRLSGIPFSLSEMDGFFTAVQNENYIEAVKIVGQRFLSEKKYARYFEGYANVIQNIINGKETNKAIAFDLVRVILNTVYDSPKIDAIFYSGKDIIGDYTKWRAATRAKESTQLLDKDANAIVNGQIPESIVDNTLSKLEEVSGKLETEEGKGMFESDIDKIRNQKVATKRHSLKDQEVIIKPSKYSDSQWISWKNKLPNKEGQDGYMELIYPDGFREKDYDPSRRVYFINGILTPLKSAKAGVREIANRLAQPVCLVYSRSLKDENTPGLTPINDLNEALLLALEGRTPFSGLILKQGIEIDLSTDKEVLVFAHSRGAAVAFNTTNSILSSRSFIESRSKNYKKLTIVTLGGYCPPRKEWSSEIIVKNHVNDGDPVPLLRGNGFSHYDAVRRIIDSDGKYLSIDYHYMSAYYKYINQYKK